MKKHRTGVYIRIIIHRAVCDDLEELHESIAKFLSLTHTKEAMRIAKANNAGEFCFSPDLKVANLAAGIMSHSTKYPCCWCNAEKGHLELLGDEPRTFRRIREKNQRRLLLAPSTNKVYAQKYESCVFNPVIGSGSGSQDPRELNERVIDVIVPGELHILMGVTMMILDMIEEAVSEESLEMWCTELGIEKRPY